MDTLENVRSETDRLEDLQALIEGQVFHVTKRAYWPSIVATGAIVPNSRGKLPTTFGASSNSFFRNRGCVSVFDYRAPPSDEVVDFRRRCWPFQAAVPNEEGIAILILNASLYPALISWDRWKEEQVWREMVVPYVEAGHPGPISVEAIDRAIFLRLMEDPNCHAAIMRRAAEGRRL